MVFESSGWGTNAYLVSIRVYLIWQFGKRESRFMRSITDWAWGRVGMGEKGMMRGFKRKRGMMHAMGEDVECILGKGVV